MRLLGALLLLAALALSADSVHIAAGRPRSLLAPRRTAPRARVAAAEEKSMDDEAARVAQASAPLGLQDMVMDSPADERVDPDDLAEMRAKVMAFQKELDSQKQQLDSEDEALERELGFFGEPIGEFLVNALKSVPEYEVPPPGVFVVKVGFSIIGFIVTLALIKSVDLVVLELFRPYVQYKVSGLPNMPL